MRISTLATALAAFAAGVIPCAAPRPAEAQASTACINSGRQPLSRIGETWLSGCFRTTSRAGERLVYTTVGSYFPGIDNARKVSSCKLYSSVATGSRTNSDTYDCTVILRSHNGTYTWTRNFGPYPYTCAQYLRLDSRLIIRYTDQDNRSHVFQKSVAISGPACR